MSIVPQIKKGNRLPILRAYLRDPAGNPAPLVSALSIQFSMRNQDTGETLLYRRPASIVDAATGEVSYAWAAGETDIPGTYDTEWVVTYPGSLPMTYPGDGFNSVVINDGIDPITP